MQNKKEKNKNLGRKFLSFLKHPFIRKNEPILHTVEWVFVLLAFFVVGLSVAYFQVSTNYLSGWWQTFTLKQEAQQIPEAEKEFAGETVSEPVVDTTGWDTYRNQWYGFEIKHPDSWRNNTQYKMAAERSARYEIIYKFRKDGGDASGVFDGYDVKIYPVKKVPNVEATNEIRKKEGAPEDPNQCSLSKEEKNFGGEEFPTLQKISVGEADFCYEPAYFYSLTKGDYIYNIVPAVGESGERFANPEKETGKIFPEYKEAIASFKDISISRPVAKPAKPRITARRPVSAKIVNGKFVCAKKNDKPRKSKNNKPGHLDLECCLDPDEKPNPWCTY